MRRMRGEADSDDELVEEGGGGGFKKRRVRFSVEGEQGGDALGDDFVSAIFFLGKDLCQVYFCVFRMRCVSLSVSEEEYLVDCNFLVFEKTLCKMCFCVFQIRSSCLCVSDEEWRIWHIAYFCFKKILCWGIFVSLCRCRVVWFTVSDSV